MDISNTLVDEVLSAYKVRDIPVRREGIESVLEDPTAGPKNAEWVSRHMQPETLLSREELALYAPPLFDTKWQ